MNTWYVRVIGLSFILSLGLAPTLRAADEAKDHKVDETKAAPPIADKRATDVEKAFPEKYDALIAKDKDGKETGILTKEVSVKAISADGDKKKDKTFKVGGANKELAEQILAIKEYREKLKGCEGDDSAKDLSKILDGYIAEIEAALNGQEAAASPTSFGELTKRAFDAFRTALNPNKTISEKMVNTYTLQIGKLLKEKAKKFDTSKKDFSDSDEKFTKALANVAAILWDGKAGDEFTREPKFNEAAASTDEETKATVENTGKAIEKLKTAEKTCELDSSSDTGGGSEETGKTGPAKDEQGPPKTGEGEPKDPTPIPPTVTNPPVPPGTPGVTPPQDINALLRQLEERQRAQETAFANQLRDAQELARRAIEDAQRQQLQNQADLERAANDDDNDALGKALEALGQQPQANKSNSKENSEQGPQISPSLESGKGGGQPNIPPPQQQPPYQPPQAMQFPPPPPATQPLAIVADPKSRFDEEGPRRQPVVVQNPQSAGILELMKLQQQLYSQMMQQRQTGGVNVNGVGSRLSGFGRMAGARGKGPGPAGLRFNGSAKSGSQATIAGNASGRTQLPPGLRAAK